MTSKTKTSIWMWAAGVFVALLYFGPSIMNPIRYWLLMRQPPKEAAAPTPPVKIEINVPAVVPGTASDPQTVQTLNSLGGIWIGETQLPARGVCRMRFELRTLPQRSAEYYGFSTLTCMPSPLEVMADKSLQTPASAVSMMTKAANPTSAIMTGKIVSGGIEYRVQKNLGVEQVTNGCAMTSLTVLPFGSQIALDWKEQESPVCRGAQMVLKRGT